MECYTTDFQNRSIIEELGNDAEAIYIVPTDQIELEIKSLRNALNEVYRTNRKIIHTPNNDRLVNNISSEYENEAPPKFEGTKRRKS